MTAIDPNVSSDAGAAGPARDQLEHEPLETVPGPSPSPSPGGRSGEADRLSAFRDGWMLMCTAVALVAMLVAIVAWGYADRSAHEARGTATATAGAAAAGTRTVAVELGDFFIKPGKLQVPSGTHVTFKVANHGAMTHDFAFNGKTTPMLAPGKSATLDVGAVAQSGTAMCTIPGHAQAGMAMAVTVTGAATTQAATPTPRRSSTSTDATINPSATPSAGWKARNPALAPAPTATVHDITLHATERVLEVAPGVKQLMWTFNDTVPGPILRGHVGDTFHVTLINDSTMGHSIDFHASETAMDTNMRTLQPGQSLTYTFTATHAGIWMYHCGTQPVLDHIGNGMYGAVVIDPPGLDKVDHEYALVQSELYLGPQGKEGDYNKMLSGQYDAVVFNGYYNQYKFAPIGVEPGQRVRTWVLDAGPNDISSFHVIGTQFDTVYKEGAYVLRPGPDEGGSQALDLAPAQGGFVEFTVPEAGTYAMVTHKFNDASRGALGQIVAGMSTMPMNH